MSYMKAAMEMLMPRAKVYKEIIELYRDKKWPDFIKACNAYKTLYENKKS